MRFPWHSSTSFVRRLLSRRDVTRPQVPRSSNRPAQDRLLEAVRASRTDAYGHDGLQWPAATTVRLGELSKLTGSVDQTLARVDRYLRREQASDRLAAVEGIFAGESDAAVETAHVWLEEAAVAAHQLREAIDNAQIATSGLARPRSAEPARFR
ncbi:MAG: hypothetical protein ACRDMV_22795 [Streptosporangiales bacterium]